MKVVMSRGRGKEGSRRRSTRENRKRKGIASQLYHIQLVALSLSQDELADVLVTLFDAKNRLASFLTRILNTEVEALESGRVDTLFRGNSIACKVLSVSFKTFGLYYLQSVVSPLIMQLIKNSDADFEVDPTRLSDPGKLKMNQKNLFNLVESFYTTIQESLPSLPLQLRMLCHILYSVSAVVLPTWVSWLTWVRATAAKVLEVLFTWGKVEGVLLQQEALSLFDPSPGLSPTLSPTSGG